MNLLEIRQKRFCLPAKAGKLQSSAYGNHAYIWQVMKYDMQLDPVASTVIVVFSMIGMLITSFAGICLWLVVRRLTVLVESYQAKIDPVLDKADVLLAMATEKLSSIGGKTEAVLAQTEAMTANVHDKVDKTATIVQRTVNAPIIGINSVWAGVSRGVKTFGTLQRDTAPQIADVETSPITTVVRQSAPV